MQDQPQVNVEDLGKAIARGISQENAQKERNTQVAAKRRDTMLRNAAEKALGRNYS